MMNKPVSFLRVGACAPAVCPANVEYNVDSIIQLWKVMDNNKVDVAVFPELCITGYTCADLFNSQVLLGAELSALDQLAEQSKHYSTAIIVGATLNKDGALYNCAWILHSGHRFLMAAKRHIPNYNEFYERRWFEPLNLQLTVFSLKGIKFGAEICEDLWAPQSPSSQLCVQGADVIFNLSASDDVIGKYSYLENLLKAHSGKNICGYVYAGAGFGESSTDLVFNAKTIIAENGRILERGKRWVTHPSYAIADIDVDALRHDRRMTGYFNSEHEEVNTITLSGQQHKRDDLDIKRAVDPRPFVPDDMGNRKNRCEEIVNIQAFGLARRLSFTGCKVLTVGVSGGLDSTLALLVACKAFDILGLDRSGIHGITMPGFGTTERTKGNADKLCAGLEITYESISIDMAVRQHFADISHDGVTPDITYENSQARMRTMILMDLANKYGGMVLGTGDLSELALGWATYNGDHMSMYNVNGGVPKTLVKYLVGWFADEPEYKDVRAILLDIVDTPVSPELLPPKPDGTIAQQTEDFVGPYELHDFFLYYTLRYGFGPQRIFPMAMKAFSKTYGTSEILRWMEVFYRRFFSQQFKRSCMPDSPKVGSVCLSPRGDWRMPSDASASLWLGEVNELKKQYQNVKC